MKRKTVTLEKYKIHPTAQIASKARLGKGVIVGAHAIIYDNVELGDYCVVGPHVIIGEPDERFYESKAYRFSKTIIGNRALIRSGTIIYAGCSIGSFFRTGHYAVIREKTRIGDHCSFGTLAQSDGNCRIGNYVRIHYNAHICQKAIVGNFVWIYPYSILVNDLHPPCNQCKQGPQIDEYAVVATRCIIFPAVKLGRSCLVGAGSVVTKDVLPETFVFGVPARKVSSVRDIPCSSKRVATPYPWPTHYTKGFPWKKKSLP